MDDLLKLKKINELKKTYRFASVGNRKESAAEHSWSCMVIADYFLPKVKRKINRQRVYELLIYHDLAEIETGDVALGPNIKRKKGGSREEQAVEKLQKELPLEISKRFLKLSEEFRKQKTIEAKFAKAIDQIDTEIHELDHKEDWKGWNEKFLRESKEKYFEAFPELKTAFEKIVVYLAKNGYLEK
jgi:putative hydrolase of HD superfamily